MKRKLIQISPSTLAVTLPAQWIRHNQLKKSDEIDIVVQENVLVVQSGTISEAARSTTLQVTDYIWQELDALYVAGYDTVDIRIDSSQERQLVHKAVRRFPGYTISTETAKTITIQDITDHAQVNITTTINRIYFMIITALEDIITAQKNRDEKTLQSMKKQDYEINSQVSLALRTLNKRGMQPMQRFGLTHTYIKLLELLADQCILLIDRPAKDIKELADLLRELQKTRQQHSPELFRRQLIRLKSLEKKSPQVASLLRALQEIELQLHA